VVVVVVLVVVVVVIVVVEVVELDKGSMLLRYGDHHTVLRCM
jgi:hypothetical protein